MGCYKTLKYTFSARFLRLVGIVRQKSGLDLKIAPKSEGLAPLLPQRKEVSICLIIIAKVKSSQTFFLESFFWLFVLGSVPYWMDASKVSSLREKLFSLKMTSQWRHSWTRPVAQCAGTSYASNNTFGDFLAHFVQTLWSLIGLPAFAVADAGVKILAYSLHWFLNESLCNIRIMQVLYHTLQTNSKVFHDQKQMKLVSPSEQVCSNDASPHIKIVCM